MKQLITAFVFFVATATHGASVTVNEPHLRYTAVAFVDAPNCCGTVTVMFSGVVEVKSDPAPAWFNQAIEAQLLGETKFFCTAFLPLGSPILIDIGSGNHQKVINKLAPLNQCPVHAQGSLKTQAGGFGLLPSANINTFSTCIQPCDCRDPIFAFD